VTFGRFLISSLFFLNVISFGFYLISLGSAEGWKRAGRAAQWLKAALSALAVFYLGTLFMHDRFGFKYVYENSSRAQELIYKISALWAGQEGTFLLWLSLLSVVGLALAYTAKEYEGPALMFASVLEISLCALLLRSSPFALAEAAGIADGMGMNALLKNPWMAIHPPIVFLGYALAAAPFVMFAAGVSKGDYTGWARRAWPWAVLSWCVLGVGIFLGSYWAYEVLGWGGYWGWDPVENASLFPWIALGALVHGLFLQGYRRKYVFWNGAMAAAAYFMVIYSTFLTRSGILSDFSVHSFEGITLYKPILFILLLTGVISVVMLVRQGFGIKQPDAAGTQKADWRPVLFSITVILFWIFFAFVFLGTSFPIISKLIMKNAAPIQSKYYVLTSVAVGIPFGLLLMKCPLFFNRRASRAFVTVVSLASLAAGTAAVIICLRVGVKHPALLAFVFTGGAAVVMHGVPFLTNLFTRGGNFGAFIAHFGVGLLFVGIIASSAGMKPNRVVLPVGGSTDVSGRKITLIGLEPFKLGYRAEIEVRDNKTEKLNVDFISQEAQGMAVNRPKIKRSGNGDIYISPENIIVRDSEAGDGEGDGEAGKLFQLGIGSKVEAEGLKLEFLKFDLSRMKEGYVGVELNVEYDGGTEKVTPYYAPGAGDETAGVAPLKRKDMTVYVAGIDPASRRVVLGIRGGNKKARKTSDYEPRVVLQVSYKPFIWLVWTGMICVSAGSLIAAWRRFSIRRH